MVEVSPTLLGNFFTSSSFVCLLESFSEGDLTGQSHDNVSGCSESVFKSFGSQVDLIVIFPGVTGPELDLEPGGVIQEEPAPLLDLVLPGEEFVSDIGLEDDARVCLTFGSGFE